MEAEVTGEGNFSPYIRGWVKNYPQCRYVLCSWLHCWLGMLRYVWSTCLLLLWCRCDLDSRFMSRVLCHKLGRSTFHLHQRREEGSDLFFYRLKVYQVPKRIEGYQCSMGTVSCHNGWSTNGSRGSRMVAQALSIRKVPDASGSFLMLNAAPHQ
jgi:hypothetical protein